MKSKLLVVLVAFVMGAVGGQIGGNLFKPAYAAPTVIMVETVHEVVARCDFTKTIVGVGSYVACVQK